MPAKLKIAGIEVGIADIERRGDKAAADLHGTGRGDGDAVRVDQKHLAVGVEPSGDGRGGRAGDAVEDRGRGIGLHEIDAAIGRRSKSCSSR